MQGRFLAALFIAAAALGGCQSESQKEAERRREENDRGSAAFKAGQAAHKIANEAEKIGAAASRKLDESARKAREGWRAQQRNDAEKKGRRQTHSPE